MSIYALIWERYTEDGLGFYDCFDVTSTVRFGTQLHGGYGQCAFTINASRDKSVVRYRLFLGAHLVLMDSQGHRIYEGRISATSMTDTGMEVRADGYYLRAGKILFDMIYSATEYTMNLVYNPSFEVNVTDSWSFSGGSGATRSQYTGDKKYGSACVKLTQATSGGQMDFYASIPVTAEKDYTFFIWVRSINVVGIPSMSIEEKDGGGGSLKTTSKTLNGINDTSWVVFELSINTVAGAASVLLHIKAPNAGTSGAFLVDGVQFEQKPYSSGYCDGDQGPLYHWSGTPHNSTSYRDASSPTVYDVIKDCVDMVPDWNAAYAQISQSNFMVGSQDFTDKKVKDAVETVTKFGYREDDVRPIYFAIWNHRRPVLIPEPSVGLPYTVDWYVSVRSVMGGQVGVSQSLDDVYNKVYAVYDNLNAGPSKTLPVEDNISKNKYGLSEGLVNNGSNPEGLALAESLRDMALERYRYPRQIFSLQLSGFVKNQAGFIAEPYLIRAGDSLLLIDLDTVSAHAGTLKGQAAEGLSGFVIKTDYDSARKIMTIAFGSSDVTFETIMARLGLSGGLS